MGVETQVYSYLNLALHRSGWSTTCSDLFTQKILGSHHNKMLGISHSQSRLEWRRKSFLPTGVRTPNSPSRSELLYQIHHSGPLSYAAVKTDTRAIKSGYTAIKLKHFITHIFTKRTTGTHFVLCNMYLSGQLVQLRLKVAMQNNEDYVNNPPIIATGFIQDGHISFS